MNPLTIWFHCDTSEQYDPHTGTFSQPQNQHISLKPEMTRTIRHQGYEYMICLFPSLKIKDKYEKQEYLGWAVANEAATVTHLSGKQGSYAKGEIAFLIFEEPPIHDGEIAVEGKPDNFVICDIAGNNGVRTNSGAVGGFWLLPGQIRWLSLFWLKDDKPHPESDTGFMPERILTEFIEHMDKRIYFINTVILEIE